MSDRDGLYTAVNAALDRFPLINLERGEYEAVAETATDAVLAAGWVSPDRHQEALDAMALQVTYTEDGTWSVLRRLREARATVQRVRDLCDEADAMNPADYRTGQGHLPPAFREINHHDAFIALAKIVNRIEATLDGPGEEAAG